MNFTNFINSPKFILLLCVLGYSWFPAGAQDPLAGPVYKSYACPGAITGCYKSFNDFNEAKPSIKLNFQMQKKNPREIRDSRADGYKIIFDKGFSPRKSIINSIWGVYYGDTLYINRMFYQGEKGFDKVYCLGSYGYFHGINPNPATSSDYNTALMSGFLFGAVGGAIAGAATDNNSRTGKFPRVMIYLIDLETGMVSPLTSFKLEKILEDDQELLDSYNKEKYKTSMMIMHAYLDTFAERRKNR